MRRLTSQLSGRRPVELDSEETYDFPARMTIGEKGLSSSDEPNGVRHQWVVF
jgi:hypothetical protein